MKRVRLGTMRCAVAILFGAVVVCASSGSSCLAAQGVPPLPALPTVYEASIDMSGHSQVTVHIKSNAYNSADLYNTVRFPPWIDVEPPSGIVGHDGFDLILRLEPEFLGPGRNTGQVILESSGGLSVITVSANGSGGGVSPSSNASAGVVLVFILGFLLLLLVAIAES